MATNNMILKEIETAVFKHQEQMLNKSLDEALDAGTDLKEIRRSLIQGVDQVRCKLMSNDMSIPDLLLSLDTASVGLLRVTSLKEGDLITENDIPLVIGVVEGDPHDLGKNIIAAIYQTCGYQVLDLGSQVPCETFVRTVQERAPKILALSAMMSTTMIAIPDIIKRVKEISPHTIIMIGGAPFDGALAKSYGSDGYAETALTILEETEAAIKRDLEGASWSSLR